MDERCKYCYKIHSEAYLCEAYCRYLSIAEADFSDFRIQIDE